MDMQNYTTPFANTGDTEEFSIDTDPSGKVSLEKGWTELYQLRPEEGGLFILRKVFNQMMKLVSTDTVTWKTQSFPNWIDDKGDGLPYAYPKNAIVKYTNGNTYVSLVNNNAQVPTGANWKLFDITALDNTVKLTGNQTIAGVKTFSSSPIVPTPTAGTQAVNKAYVDNYVNNNNALPIGTILSGYTIFANCIVAFGGEFNRADYPRLWAYLQGKSFLKSDAEWQDEATANDGICGFYSTGDGTTTFRVPNLDKAFLRPDNRGVGSYQGDAIRNITGDVGGVRNDTTSIPPTGPFSVVSFAGNFGPGGGALSNINFNASRVVPTAPENRPKNIAVLPLIVAK